MPKSPEQFKLEGVELSPQEKWREIESEFRENWSTRYMLKELYTIDLMKNGALIIGSEAANLKERISTPPTKVGENYSHLKIEIEKMLPLTEDQDDNELKRRQQIISNFPRSSKSLESYEKLANWVAENRLEPEEVNKFLENPSKAENLIVKRAVEDAKRLAKTQGESEETSVLGAKSTALAEGVRGYMIATRGRQFNELIRLDVLTAEDEARFENEHLQRIQALLDKLTKARLFFIAGKINRKTYEQLLKSLAE